VLTVRGEKRSERKEGEDDSRYHLVERSYGGFARSFQLPQGLDESKIEADFSNGILSIHVPKTALPQPHRIHIGNRTSTHQGQISQQSAQKNGGESVRQADGNTRQASKPTRTQSGTQSTTAENAITR
jgi:HSP20 family protein